MWSPLWLYASSVKTKNKNLLRNTLEVRKSNSTRGNVSIEFKNSRIFLFTIIVTIINNYTSFFPCLFKFDIESFFFMLKNIILPVKKMIQCTGKSLSGALLFAEYGENMLCTKIVLNVRNNFCTQPVLPRFELGIFMY